MISEATQQNAQATPATMRTRRRGSMAISVRPLAWSDHMRYRGQTTEETHGRDDDATARCRAPGGSCSSASSPTCSTAGSHPEIGSRASASSRPSLGVGRSSVREALRVLEVMGLIRTGTGSGPTSGAIIIATPRGGMSALLRLQVAASGFPLDDVVRTRLVLECAVVEALAADADRSTDAAHAVARRRWMPPTSRRRSSSPSMPSCTSRSPRRPATSSSPR